MRRLAVAVFLLLAVGWATGASAGNPFVSGKPAPAPESVESAPAEAPGVLARVYAWSSGIQREIKSRLGRLAREMRREPWGAACLAFFGLCFLYGAAHALGPGHGKSVVCAYFLGRPGSLWSGLAMGCAIPFIHVGSAVAVVLAGVKLLSLAGLEFLDASEDWLMTASYAFLLVIGLALAVRAVWEMRAGGPVRCEMPRRPEKGRIALVSLAAGIVPCPGAAIILVFAMSLGLTAQGLAAMVFLAAGMAATTSAFAMAAVASRGAALKLSANHGRLFAWVYGGLAVAGALVVAGFGGLMLLGRLAG
ncbi:MAG: nickel/cobalt transporter [Desulfovibrionaceae bacterium]